MTSWWRAYLCNCKSCYCAMAHPRMSPYYRRSLFYYLWFLSLLLTLSVFVSCRMSACRCCSLSSLSYQRPFQTKSILSTASFNSTVLETEVAKYLRTVVESQLPRLFPQYAQIGDDFQKLCLQNGITDSTRSNLLHAYSIDSNVLWIVTLLLSLPDEKTILSQTELLISSFLS